MNDFMSKSARWVVRTLSESYGLPQGHPLDSHCLVHNNCQQYPGYKPELVIVPRANLDHTIRGQESSTCDHLATTPRANHCSRRAHPGQYNQIRKMWITVSQTRSTASLTAIKVMPQSHRAESTAE